MTTPTTPAALSIASQFLKTEAKIIAWLKKMGVKNYTLVPNDTYGFVVDVAGDVDFSQKRLKKLSVKFNHVKGDFGLQGNKLTSLAGCPEVVEGSFYCCLNKLTSLEHSPQIVDMFFDCSYNDIESLEHVPRSVKHFESRYFTHEQYIEYIESIKLIETEKELFESMIVATNTSTQKRSNKI